GYHRGLSDRPRRGNGRPSEDDLQRGDLMSSDQLSRRGFVGAVGAGGAAAWAVSTGKAAVGANDRVRLGLIGAGSRGGQLLDTFLRQEDAQVVSVCDVDDKHAQETAERIKKHDKTDDAPKTARDYRELLDNKDVDAVIIATPDHWHALPAIHA